MLNSILTLESDCPPPLPPSRTASIRPEPSSTQPRSNPSHFHRPSQDGNSDDPGDGPTTSVAALRAAMFGEKQSGPHAPPKRSTMNPPVLPKKSNTKPSTYNERPTPSATNRDAPKKSSVMKIAAALESNKCESSSGDEADNDSQESVDAHLTSNPPIVAKRTQTRLTNRQANLYPETEGDTPAPLGAPYEVPKQGNTNKVSRRAFGHDTSRGSDCPQALNSRQGNDMDTGPTQTENQSSLANSLQAALAKRALKNAPRQSESDTERHLNVSHSKPRAGNAPNTNIQQQPVEQVTAQNYLPQQPQNNLLNRIRQRKAQRNAISDNTTTPTTMVKNDAPRPVEFPSSNVTTPSNQAAEEHQTPPALPDPSPKRHTKLRRSSSNVSSIRITDHNSTPALPESEKERRANKVQRSPSSASSRLHNIKVSQPSAEFENSSQKLKRTPSNASRRSSEERVPQLPPRASASPGPHTWEEKPTSNVSIIHVDTNDDSSSAAESMVLADFISRYSSALPMAVSIQDATSVSSKRLLATGQCNMFNVHFLKHSKVVVVHDSTGSEHFSVPLNSCVKFGLIYDQQSNTDYNSYFETAGDLMSLKQLPYVICATKEFDGGSAEKSVETGEVLFVRGIKKTKAIGRGKVLKANTIGGVEKLLSAKCCGGFTTSPSECRLSLSDMMEHSIPLPQHALIFSESQVVSYLPKSMTNQPITLVKIQGESSAIMTPRYDNATPKDQSWMYDVATDVKLWVNKVQLSKKEQEDLNGETNVLHATFDPVYTQHYAEKSDDNGIALQHILVVNLLPGKEKEGVHLYLPGATMTQQSFDSNDAPELMSAADENQDSTYAVHITEQRKPIRKSEQNETSIAIASTNIDESSYIPPNEDSDIDEPEEAYEEVMTALESAMESKSDPQEQKMGRFAGMIKSMKQTLARTHREEVSQPEVPQEDVGLIDPTTDSEPEDYDNISFGDHSEEEDQSDIPPPLPDTSQIIGRRPPQIPAPPVPVEQTPTTSIALQRLMAAAKLSHTNAASSTNAEQELNEQADYHSVSGDDEMVEDEESGYSDVRSLIPSMAAATQSSIAAALSKRKPPLPQLPPKEKSPGAVSIKSTGHSSITSAGDKVEPLQVESIVHKSSLSLSDGSGEGDQTHLRGLYIGLQTKVNEMMEEMSEMKGRIEELSKMVEDLTQRKKFKMENPQPSKTQTLPRRLKAGRMK